MSDRDPVWQREDKTRWRMTTVPGEDGGEASKMILVPFGITSENRSDVVPQVFHLVGSVPK